MVKSLLSIAMFLATGLTAAAQDNLVKNGDFENWDGNAPTQWQKSGKGKPPLTPR